jgi:pyruvate dehydrogenase E1 component alpha subunit
VSADASLELRLLESMFLIRAVEDKLASVYSEGEIRTPMHLCTGQEAVPAACSEVLREGDAVFSGHRSHGHYLSAGGDLFAMFSELLGRDTGCCRGLGGSQHLSDPEAGFIASAPILAATVPVAVGFAWRLRERGIGQVAVSFLGDAVVEEGVFHESVSFATLHRLPVVFICENNLYSVHAHLNVRQPDRSIASLAAGHGLEAHGVDGNDALAVYSILQESLERVRAGRGPVFIEAATYRLLEHVGPSTDWHLGYRSADEGQVWSSRDPIQRMKAIIQANHDGSSDELFGEMNQKVRSYVELVYQRARSSDVLSLDELKRFVYPA